MDQIIAQMSSDRLMVAYHRTLKALGTETPDCSCPIFHNEFQLQLENLAYLQVLDDLQEMDVVTADVDSDGFLRYNLTRVAAVA